MVQNRLYVFCLVLISCTLFFGVRIVYSEEFTSSNYRLLNPVMNSGGYGSSASFRLSGVIGEVSIGTSTSTSFGNNAGFLFFPFASTPSVSATAGNGEVALSWTASTGYLGWTASGYNRPLSKVPHIS